MSRRIVPGTFWVGILACALLLVAGTLSASGPPHRPPDLRGVWDGFFLAADGATGLVQSDITEQDFRRLAGAGALLDAEGRIRFNTFNYNATMVPPNFITGTGRWESSDPISTGRLVFQADLETFPGVGGDAGVMYPEYHFVPSRGGESRVSALLLHPFPGVAGPGIAGSYEGHDPAFGGIVRMQIFPRNDRGSFDGHVEIFPDPEQPPAIFWPSLATTSDDGRFLWISQGAAGRIIYDGVVVSTPDTPVARIDGVFRLLLNDARPLFNAWNCIRAQ